MARRRLTPLDLAEDVPRAEQSSAAAPIARVAAEAAGAAALEELSDTLRRARETGRLVLDLPLDAIAPDHLARDRLPFEDEDMAALRASLRAHGQRAPIEVTPVSGALPYGLISGWRRLAALKALHDETADPRFATVQALVRRPETAADAYVAMVEENELRVGLSQYERARVAARAAARGVFGSENAALHALFAGASRAKLSRIRAFLALHHAIDDVLRFPQAIPERLGLRLAEQLRANPAGTARLRAELTGAAAATAEAELALLERLATPPRPPEAPVPGGSEILPGVRLTTRLRGQRLRLTLEGAGVTPDLHDRVTALLEGLRPAHGKP